MPSSGISSCFGTGGETVRRPSSWVVFTSIASS
jgi:hypothetical protein